MTDQIQQRAKELFIEACMLDPNDRSAFLEKECVGEDSIRAEVESLLQNHDAIDAADALQADQREAHLHAELADDPDGQEVALRLLAHLDPKASFVNMPHDKSDKTTELPGSKPALEKIGHYSIKHILGSGGMGHVYLAQQEQPRRVVALKVMKKGLASKSALRRFEYESQILARLKHPNIAQVYEAGTHDDGEGGVPYFAMEFITNAKSIIEYATSKNLGTRECLALFTKVCEAVHHGHQKGIIHRDLKPGNILIDSGGEPKIIDFGVARATDSDLALTTLQTDMGQLIGTLQYMSPEQCEGDPHDLDTRSDVYALGVVLYELLTEQLPYDVSKVAIFEATRVIREETPAKLSTINKTLRGDVETITLKALEKDRERRYTTASDLGRDVQRYLNNEPIEARPASMGYQFQKFAKRNRALVGGVVAVFIVLVMGVIVSINYAVAESAARADAESARIDANRQTVIAEEVNDFLNNDLLLAVKPAAEGIDVTVREVLDEASRKIVQRFGDEPLVRARVRLTLGEAYLNIGEYDAAELHLADAWKTRRTLLGEENELTLTVKWQVAQLYTKQGRYKDAELLVNDLLTRARVEYGEDDARSMSLSNDLASIYHFQGRYNEAELLFRKTLMRQQAGLGNDDPETLATLNDLALLLRTRGHYTEAQPLYEQVVSICRRVFGDQHAYTLIPRSNLAELYMDLGKLQEAESIIISLLPIERKVFGEDHPTVLSSRSLLGVVRSRQGRLSEAEQILSDVLDDRQRVLGEQHAHTFNTMMALGWVYGRQARYDDAESLIRQSLDGQQRIQGDEHLETLRTKYVLAYILGSVGRVEESEDLLLSVLDVQKRVLDEDHPDTLDSINLLGWNYGNRGLVDKALPLFTELIERQTNALGGEHPQTLRTANNLASMLIAKGNFDEAVPLLTKTLAIRRRVIGADNTETLICMANLGNAYNELGRFEESHPVLSELVERGREVLPAGHWNTGVFLSRLGTCLVGLERFEEAESALLEGREFIIAVLGEASKHTIQSTQGLIDLYVAWGKPETAKLWRQKLPNQTD